MNLRDKLRAIESKPAKPAAPVRHTPPAGTSEERDIDEFPHAFDLLAAR